MMRSLCGITSGLRGLELQTNAITALPRTRYLVANQPVYRCIDRTIELSLKPCHWQYMRFGYVFVSRICKKLFFFFFYFSYSKLLPIFYSLLDLFKFSSSNLFQTADRNFFYSNFSTWLIVIIFHYTSV